jgi:hypothetical protein
MFTETLESVQNYTRRIPQVLKITKFLPYAISLTIQLLHLSKPIFQSFKILHSFYIIAGE